MSDRAECMRTFGAIEATLKDNKESVDRVEACVKEIKKVLLGNGEPGIVGRIDRLEQRAAYSKWIVGLIATPVVGLVGKAAYDYLKGGQ